MRSYTPRYVVAIAKELRQNQTEAETLLWEQLRNNRLNGYKFYRQCAIGRYIADFYCVKLRLVIELDGNIHDNEDQKEYDAIRQKEIEGRHLKVLRFRNEQVLEDMGTVLSMIGSCADPEINEALVKPSPATTQ